MNVVRVIIDERSIPRDRGTSGQSSGKSSVGISENIVEKNNNAFFAVIVKDVLRDESGINGDADWMLISVIIQISELEGKWNLKANKE